MRSKKAIYNVSTKLLLQLVTIVYGFIIPKIIINNFGSTVNGLVSSITQFLGYITLLESGFGPVVKATLYKPIANKDRKTIANILKATEKFFRIISYIFIAYIFILALCYPLIVNDEFGYFYTLSLIIIISISTFAEYYFGMTYRLYLQAEQSTYIISIVQIVTYIISVVVVVLLVKYNCSIHIIKLLSGLVFVSRPLFQNFYVKRKFNIDFKDTDNNYKIKQKWDGLVQHIAFVIHENTDITILTLLCSLTEVSVYYIYHMIVLGVRNIVFSLAEGIDSSFGDMLAKNEKENLKEKFGMYETIYDSICTIAYSCALILIVPFVKVYMSGVTDANYVRYTFGILIVISEYIFAIRMPYSTLTKAAGHFKETRIGACVEALSNIIISVILVWKYGIIGVTIGTIFAMTIRTIEFVYHTNKYILNRSLFVSVRKIALVTIETILIVFICKYLPYFDYNNYLNWFINAVMVGITATILTLTINYIFYKKDLKKIIKLLSNVFKKK